MTIGWNLKENVFFIQHESYQKIVDKNIVKN